MHLLVIALVVSWQAAQQEPWRVGAGDPVLLTWKNVDKTQRAVAIEFVPRPEK
jgi:hypothetical protein